MNTKTKTIARQIALIAALGLTASAHAQLLGGGRLGGSLGGMVGGGGQFGSMGVPVTRVDSLGEARRATRAADTEALRRNASVDGSASGQSAVSAAAGMAGKTV